MEDIEELKKKQDQEFNVIVKNREMLQINEKEIKELKENITIVANSSGNFEDMLLSKTNKNKDVLRNILKEFEENHDDSIHRNFFTIQLEKLDDDSTFIKEVCNTIKETEKKLKDGEKSECTALRSDQKAKSAGSVLPSDSTPSEPQTWRGEVPLIYCNEKKGDFDREKEPTPSKDIECNTCEGGFEWDDGEIDCDKRCQKEPTDVAGSARQTVSYIERKGIFLSDFYHNCNRIDCPISEATLSYEGNYYCLKHFVEIIQDDRMEKADLEYLIDDIIIDEHLKIISSEDIEKIHKIKEKCLGKDEGVKK